MIPNETYYVVKPVSPFAMCSVFEMQRDGSIKQTLEFQNIMGYFEDYVYKFWNKLSPSQKEGAYIIPRRTLKELNDEIMPDIVLSLLSGRVKEAKSLYKKVWVFIKKSAINPEDFKELSNNKEII